MNEDIFRNKFQPFNFPKLGYIKIPPISREIIPEKYRNLSSKELLEKLIHDGLEEKIASGLVPASKKKIYEDRIALESKIIFDLGFADYFLLVWSIIRFCKNNNILNGHSRGSVGGSLVCFLIDIIKIDPIKYDLLFERFISAERAKIKEIDGETYVESSSLPDIDIDSQFKQPVLEFIQKSFPNRTCSISTISCLTGKALLRDVLKCYLEYKPEHAQEITDKLEKKFGVVEAIPDALQNNKVFSEWASKNLDVVNIAIGLENLYRQKGVHASGVLISEYEVGEDIPTEMSQKGDLATAFDMNYAQMFGIKVDNLGIETLSLIKEVCDRASIKMEDIDTEDPEIYKWLNLNSNYYGLFQISEGVGYQTVKKVQPENLSELALCLALGRPGAMRYIDKYVKVKRGEEEIYIHPNILNILSPTAGAIVYQEQLMALARKMAGFTPNESNTLRSIVGKKKISEMPKYEQKFIDGCLTNGYDEKYAREIWASFVDSASYSFNKCLSPDTVIEKESGVDVLENVNIGDKIRALDVDSGEDIFVEVLDKMESEQEIYEITLQDGRVLKCSMDHKILTRNNGMQSLKDILKHDYEIVTD